jgi:hypothetical protein
MTRTSRLVDGEMAVVGERIAEAAALIDSATGALLADVRAFDAGEGWAAQGALSCAHWLSWRVGLDLGAAREKVRVARALGELKQIDEALRRGEVSYSKVRAMTRVAKAENERALLELARASTAAQLEKACRLYRQQTAPTKEVLEQSRYVRVRECDDGMVLLQVKVTADEAALVLEACRVSAETGNAAEGLMVMAERAVRGASGDEAGQSKPPVEVVVHVDAATLAGHTETSHGVSAETSRRLLCDCGVVPVLEDSAGRVIDAGKKRRTVSASLRRALTVRDGGCRFPSCTNRRVDAHHLHHWLDGGETTLDNTALLCRRHHRLVHEERFTVDRSADGSLTFHDPHGQAVPPTGLREPRVPADGIVVLRRRAHEADLSIDADTAYPTWDGHHPDYDSILMTL